MKDYKKLFAQGQQIMLIDRYLQDAATGNGFHTHTHRIRKFISADQLRSETRTVYFEWPRKMFM